MIDGRVCYGIRYTAVLNKLHIHPVAIDLSDGLAATAVQMTSRRGVCMVRDAVRQTLTPTDSATESDAQEIAFVREALRRPAFKGKSVALLPPLDTMLSYPLHVVPGKQETLEAAIVREAAVALDAPLDEMMIDFASVRADPSGDQGTHSVLLVAISRADVERHMRLVKQAGGVLESIDFAATALIRIHSASTRLSANPVLLCHLGSSRTVIVVADADGIVAHRNLSWGTGRLIRKLVDNIELGGRERDADFLIRKHGVREALGPDAQDARGNRDAGTAGPVAQLLVPLVDELVHELHNITAYVRSQAANVSFDGLWLYGDGACVGGLDRYVASELALETTAPDPLQAVKPPVGTGGPLPDDGAPFAMGLGLAMRKVQWL